MAALFGPKRKLAMQSQGLRNAKPLPGVRLQTQSLIHSKQGSGTQALSQSFSWQRPKCLQIHKR
ncbi:MAG: hypothetical protein EBS75_05350 [Betaproteobacteria bacterium]|nr:hypothetical protein [Betaproteobacteria bacterium]